MEHTIINCNGKLLNLSNPLIMGIVNITDDSFYDGGKYVDFDEAMARCEDVISQGADIIDLGACSTRPGAEFISVEKEMERLLPVITEVKRRYPQSIISIDTCWSKVVTVAVEAGADIINDISGGQFDTEMFSTIARCQVPYILMHTGTTPNRMQQTVHYNNLFLDLMHYFTQRIGLLRELGVKDIILDLGFGFGKTPEHNYELLKRQNDFKVLELPILTGISRKSMIYKPLGITPQQSLNGTTFLHAFALANGANILRVHDVGAAKECINLFKLYNKSTN
ncbi:MAG: dihydropteroate synthase [Bacteroidales bacterium]|jgi:dihydropteroate synthase|nr:dihydropteroate synthase [Bacteroidales bacterium]